VAADFSDDPIYRRNCDRIREKAERAGLPLACIEPLLEHLVPMQSAAGVEAKRYQWWHFWASRGVFCLSASAVTAAVGQVVLYPEQHWLVVAELIFMGLAGACLWLGRVFKWHTRWLNNRYTAEQLRIWQYVLVVGEVEHRPDEAVSRLPFYRALAPGLPEEARRKVNEAVNCLKRHSNVVQLRKFLVDAWLEDQRKWHEDNGERKHGAALRVHVSLYVLFAGTFLAALFHFLHLGHGRFFAGAEVSDWISAMAIVLPAWGGAVHGISKQFQHERVAVRSEQMADVLETLVTQANGADTIEKLRAVASEAAQVMSLENFEWAAQIRLEPGDPPT
jgi:hypothetical protein